MLMASIWVPDILLSFLRVMPQPDHAGEMEIHDIEPHQTAIIEVELHQLAGQEANAAPA